jgi:hypothetical protein
MPDEKLISSVGFLPTSLMYFCSGEPMHFCSGVDRARAQETTGGARATGPMHRISALQLFVFA